MTEAELIKLVETKIIEGTLNDLERALFLALLESQKERRQIEALASSK